MSKQHPIEESIEVATKGDYTLFRVERSKDSREHGLKRYYYYAFDSLDGGDCIGSFNVDKAVPKTHCETFLEAMAQGYERGFAYGKGAGARQNQNDIRRALGINRIAEEVADRVGDRLANGFQMVTSDIPF